MHDGPVAVGIEYREIRWQAGFELSFLPSSSLRVRQSGIRSDQRDVPLCRRQRQRQKVSNPTIRLCLKERQPLV